MTARRTAKDFAEVLRGLVEDVHVDAGTVVLVTDNRNTHGRGACTRRSRRTGRGGSR